MWYYDFHFNSTNLFDAHICMDLVSSNCEFAEQSDGIHTDTIYLNHNLEQIITRKVDCTPFRGIGEEDYPCDSDADCKMPGGICADVKIYERNDYEDELYHSWIKNYKSCKTPETMINVTMSYDDVCL